MRVLILGADGYLGWPTSMYFSKKGHELLAVDNYFRRKAASDIDCTSLVLSPELGEKSRVWQELTGKEIKTAVGDVTDYAFLSKIFEEFSPEVVIHYAEQPSAVYSMMDRDKAALTLHNNLMTTLNVIYAVKEFAPDCHIVKLGTMGEYGTPDIDIEEGWLDIEHNGRSDRFLFPRQAGSLYHTTKIQDTDMLWLYVRMWGLRVTDLMQGPVYGISTDETDLDDRLLPNFHYDEVFGTVLNRFVVQSVAGYPLTVYGSGKQTRGYLNLRDTMQCVYLSAMNRASEGELRVYNQMTETFSVNELAARIKAVGDRLGYNVELNQIENPRVEKEDHYYNPKYTGLVELGLEPHLLTDEVLEGMFKMVDKYKDKINIDAIFRGVQWK
ncbi:UDP-sulfoquinovose synthase [hydrothermal vent metagenome]|uniref:UDP-sulfoquinovose synthase n=1 Tax=hydrothermal vent metagenome TaxID=652676 RepID=A0A3B0QPX0_9ZZZZ